MNYQTIDFELVILIVQRSQIPLDAEWYFSVLFCTDTKVNSPIEHFKAQLLGLLPIQDGSEIPGFHPKCLASSAR